MTAVDTTISSSEDMQTSRIVYSPEKHSSRVLHYDYMLPTEMSSIFPNIGDDAKSITNRAHIATRSAVLCLLFLCFWSFGSSTTLTFRKPGFCV